MYQKALIPTFDIFVSLDYTITYANKQQRNCKNKSRYLGEKEKFWLQWLIKLVLKAAIYNIRLNMHNIILWNHIRIIDI